MDVRIYRYQSVINSDNVIDADGRVTCCTDDNDDLATGTCRCHDDDNVNNVKLTETLRLLTETHRLLQASVRRR